MQSVSVPRIQCEQLERRTLLSTSVYDLDPSNNPAGTVGVINGVTVFAGSPLSWGDVEPWATNGSSTWQLADIRNGFGSSNPSSFTNFNGQLYFAATASDTIRYLYRTDGTVDGTVPVRALSAPGVWNIQQQELFVVNGNLVIVPPAEELLRMNSAGSISTLSNIHPNGYPEIQHLQQSGDWLFFSADDGQERREYRTDGTPSGTTLVPPGNAPNFAWVRNGTLRVYGTDSADEIYVELKAGDPSKLVVRMNSFSAEFNTSEIDLIRVWGGDGDDRIMMNHTPAQGIRIRTVIYGDGGNDTIQGGMQRDRIFSGEGDDWISAGNGNDIVYGGPGNDVIFGGHGKDYLDGGPGNDWIDGNAGWDRIIGGPGRDTLIGMDARDTIWTSQSDDDVIEGIAVIAYV
jgi:ELWxxDGT repeat protein